MKIAICGSMIFSEKMLGVKEQLEKLGHRAVVSKFAYAYAGRDEEEKLRLTIHDKNENDAIRDYWEVIKECDAILVLNYTRRGVENYVGGNTLMEIGFAHVLHKQVYLLNPVPEIDYYKSEIEAVKPVILNGELCRINQGL